MARDPRGSKRPWPYGWSWSGGSRVQFRRVVQGGGSLRDGWDAVSDVNGESLSSLSLGTDLSTPHYLRVRIAGRRLSMRAWAVGEAEPDIYQSDDSTSVGGSMRCSPASIAAPFRR